MRFLSILGGLSLFMMVACNSTPGGSEADTTEAKSLSSTAGSQGTIFNIDTAGSKLLWEGSKLIGGAHSGVVPIASGSLQLIQDKITGGSFTIDMKDLQPLDQDSASNAKLKAHLSSSDFFAVDSFPTATFALTSVVDGADTTAIGAKGANVTITGNLTIKTVTKSIRFPAKLTNDSKLVAVQATFTIDRTKWGVNYGSENSIKDKIISKDIEFMVDVKAKK